MKGSSFWCFINTTTKLSASTLCQLFMCTLGQQLYQHIQNAKHVLEVKRQCQGSLTTSAKTESTRI